MREMGTSCCTVPTTATRMTYSYMETKMESDSCTSLGAFYIRWTTPKEEG